jgi:hypothetical protein
MRPGWTSRTFAALVRAGMLATLLGFSLIVYMPLGSRDRCLATVSGDGTIVPCPPPDHSLDLGAVVIVALVIGGPPLAVFGLAGWVMLAVGGAAVAVPERDEDQG